MLVCSPPKDAPSFPGLPYWTLQPLTPENQVLLDDVDVPCTQQVGRENLVGNENGALLCMMRNLEIERVTLAAMGLGIAS